MSLVLATETLDRELVKGSSVDWSCSLRVGSVEMVCKAKGLDDLS